MRILLTAHQFVPDFQSGTEILTFSTAKALQARGHDVSVFTGFPARGRRDIAPHVDRYVHEGIPVERFHFEPAAIASEIGIIAATYNNSWLATHLREFLTRNRPDVVHFFHLQRLSASAIDVCRDLGLPMVLTATDYWAVCPTNQLLLPDGSPCRGPSTDSINCLRHVVALSQTRFVERGVSMIPDWALRALVRGVERAALLRGSRASDIRALRARHRFVTSRINSVDRITVSTRLMETIFRDNGVDASRMTFLPFGIDTSALARRHAANDGGALRIGFIGTLYEHKGAHVLVEAVRRLAPRIDVAVKIYGSSDHFPAYAARLRALAAGDSRIAFCGAFPNSTIGDVFASLDVLVVASIWYENTPLVIYTAQACGCPVIASDVGGLTEVVADGVNGLLFEAGNAQALARAIERLARDPALLRKLTEQAKPPKAIGVYAAELEDLYREVLAQRRAA